MTRVSVRGMWIGAIGGARRWRRSGHVRRDVGGGLTLATLTLFTPTAAYAVGTSAMGPPAATIAYFGFIAVGLTSIAWATSVLFRDERQGGGGN